MWYKFVCNNRTIAEEDHPSNAQATKRAEELSNSYGLVEAWTPAFVVVPETVFKVMDYSKGKETQNEIQSNRS